MVIKPAFFDESKAVPTPSGNYAVPVAEQNGSAVGTSGRNSVATIEHDYSAVNVTTGAYVEILTTMPALCNRLEVFDSSGESLQLAFGAIGSEVDQAIITPGGNDELELTVPAGTRLSVKAIDNDATVGKLNINCLS